MHNELLSNRTFNSETARSSGIIPGQLRTDAAELIKFLEEYYRLMNNAGNSSNLINDFLREHDIDSVTESFFSGIQNLIAKNIPNSVIFDRQTLYKRIIDYYSLRGSEASVKAFFKIFYNLDSTVYYPKDHLIEPSQGKFITELRYVGNWKAARKFKRAYAYIRDWANSDITHLEITTANSGAETEENWTISDYNYGYYQDSAGFTSLSDNKLQDGHYWQKYSYVINTDIAMNYWYDNFLKLVHPAGLIFFNRVLYLAKTKNEWNKEIIYTKKDFEWRVAAPELGYHSPKYQPGDIDNRKVPYDIISRMTSTINRVQVNSQLNVILSSSITALYGGNVRYISQLHLNSTDYMNHLKFIDSSMEIGYMAQSIPPGLTNYSDTTGLLSNFKFPPVAIGTYIKIVVIRTLSAQTAQSSNILTFNTDISNIKVGVAITGTNVPGGATVTSIISSTQIGMSVNATTVISNSTLITFTFEF